MQKKICFALLTSQVQAWGSAGHLLVARIANDLLEKESPKTIENVTQILTVLKQDFPTWT